MFLHSKTEKFDQNKFLKFLNVKCKRYRLYNRM